MLVFNKLANATRLLLLCETILTADFSSLTQRITESQCNQTEMIVSEWYLQSHLISFADMTNLFIQIKLMCQIRMISNKFQSF